MYLEASNPQSLPPKYGLSLPPSSHSFKTAISYGSRLGEEMSFHFLVRLLSYNNPSERRRRLRRRPTAAIWLVNHNNCSSSSKESSVVVVVVFPTPENLRQHDGGSGGAVANAPESWRYVNQKFRSNSLQNIARKYSMTLSED